MSNTTSCTVNKAVSLFPLPNDLSDGAKFPLETNLDKMVSSMLLSVQTQSVPLKVVPIGMTATEPAPIGSNATAATSPAIITMPVMAPTITTPLNVVPIGMTATEPAPVATSTVIEAPLPAAPLPAAQLPAEVSSATIAPEVAPAIIPSAEDVKVGEAAGEPLIFNPVTPNATISSVLPKVEGFRSNLKQKLGFNKIEGFSSFAGSSIKAFAGLVVLIIIILTLLYWFFGFSFLGAMFLGTRRF
jgi:hypothetical protein